MEECEMVLLYEHPLSPYVQKVKIALRTKAIPFEIRSPLGDAGDPADAFAAANPRGEVPALVDGGLGIFDSTIILEYVEEKWPVPPLLPADPAGRARVRMIEEVCDTHYEAVNWGLGEVIWFGRGEGEAADTLKAAAGEQIAGLHRWLDEQLGDRNWFNGDAFGWGDLAVVPYAQMSAVFGFRPEEGSRLSRWLARVSELPAVAATAAEAAASLASIPDFAQMIASGAFKREYRDHRLEWMIRSGGIEVVLDGMRRGDIRFSQGFV
jgi:glutathione S-transferase/RNA polymerase-associated protein